MFRLSIAFTLFTIVPLSAVEPGLQPRKPWLSSKVVGSPEPPPPYQAARAFPDAKFDHPLLIARQPGTGTLFIGEQAGKIFALKEGKPILLADLPKNLTTIKETPGAEEFENLYGFVFHPKFAENRTCFICYTWKGKKGTRNLSDGTRVSRFKVKDDNTLDFASEEFLLGFLQGGHNGGDLHFGPDGFLYISSGDAASPNPPDEFKTGQDVSDFLSSVLRIDVDHKDEGKNYAIPKDNPFVGQTHNNKPIRPEIWSYGFRNPWRMSFDRKTRELWVGDVGWEAYEMVYRIEKGGNYGWSVVEGRQPINADVKVGPTPIRPPVIELDHAAAASVTGGYVYHGKKFPELEGRYIFGDWETRRMWAATIKDDRLVKLDELTTPSVRVVAFGEDAEGEIYFLDYDTGTVHTLEKNTSPAYDPAKFPKKLSETGLLEDTKAHKLAEGVQPFSVNVPMWSDGAEGERFIALPGTSSVKDYDEKKSLPGNVVWHKYKLHFPKNAVLGKTLTLKLDKDKSKRVETQLLHFDGENWAGYTYAWNDEQTDAELVPADGHEKLFVVADKRVPGGKREQMWQFASRSQCVQCHNAWAEVTLAFNLEQLNMKAFGRNQYAAFCEIGLIERIGKDGKPKAKLEDADAEAMKAFKPIPPEAGFFISDKGEVARSYLHVNCAHCHRFGGGGAVNFELTFESDLKKVIDVPPTRGDFGIQDAKLIALKQPKKSTLLFRMAKFGKDRMPHIGSELVDVVGVNLIYQWINSPDTTSAVGWTTNTDPKLEDLGRSLQEAITMGRGWNKDVRRDTLLDLAAKLPPGTMRDLFTGYFPPDGKERTLGPNPKPRAIMALKGDPERGKALFTLERMQCINCHKHEGKGNEIGPDLSKIGKERSRDELLESLLDPSRRVEPKFQSYILKTIDGQALTGLLVSKDAKQVVLKDALNKLHTVAVEDVELLQPSRQSLMPSGLLADLTPQQAADLLEWLANRK